MDVKLGRGIYVDTAVLEGILSFQNSPKGRWLGSSPYCDGFFSLPPHPHGG